MIITSRLAMWESSWAMTPSSSAGVSSSMMPVVAHTVAFLGERPSANAFGIAMLATATFGFGRSACTHRRSIIACSCGASCGVTTRAPMAASASLSDVKNCRAASPPRITITRIALWRVSTRTTPSATYTAPSRNMVVAMRICRPVSLPNEVGLGIWSLIFAGSATALSRFTGVVLASLGP